MRQSHPNYSLSELCALFGVTRQAFYEAQAHDTKTSIANMMVLTLVRELRKNIPMIGTRKLLFMLAGELKTHGIKMGRDQLFDLLRFHGLLVRRRQRLIKTTNSHHWLKKYPNLTVGVDLSAPEQLWVSDITYIRTLQGFSYLSLITDAYSRKIVGYELCETLEAIGPIGALKRAVSERQRNRPYLLVHHSDRGVQYCCEQYVDILIEQKISISMTQSGSPYENALAERVNGIIKNEFFPKRVYQNHNEASHAIDGIIEAYNQLRPHTSLNYLTPNQAHISEGPFEKRWKNYPQKQRPNFETGPKV